LSKRFRAATFARLAGIALIVFAAACSGAAPAEDAAEPAESGATEAAPAAAPADYLYVASQSGPAVSVIDMGTRELVDTIWLTDLGFTPNAKPHDVVVEPDGSAWYVSLIADGFVLKFNRDNELLGRAEFETPGMMALDPVQDLLYVGRSMAAVNPPQRIGVIERSDMAIEEYDVFFPRPHAIAAAKQGGRVFTASLAVNQIASLAPADEDLQVINVDGPPHTFVQFAVSPDGNLLVAGGQVSGEVLVWDISDPAAPTLFTRFEIGGQPWHPTYSPDGRFVYFPQRTANSVAVVDTSSWEVVDTIEGDGLAEPHGSAISPDGSTLWVSNRNTEGVYPTTIAETTKMAGDPLPAGTVVAIDTQTREIVAVIEVPAYAAGVGARAPR